MEKTKLGLSVSLMAVIMCLVGWFGGYVPAIIVAGYILIAEENKFLKQTAVKVVAIMLAFSLASIVINFLPNFFDIIESFIEIFRGDFYFSIFDRMSIFLGNVLSVLKVVVFAGLAVMSFKEKSIKIDCLDKYFEE